MQFQQSEHLQRPGVPPDSPWRTNQNPFSGAESHSLNSTGGAQNNTQGGIKLQNLPRIGLHSQGNDSNKDGAQVPPGTQSSAAQAAQQSQNSKHEPTTPAAKVIRGSSKYSSANNSPTISQSGGKNSDYSNNSGAQILGSVNSQMMPRVNTSHGMSSLNTVLPGMSNSTASSAKQKTVKQAATPLRTPMLQNLSIDDKNNGNNSTINKHIDTEKYGLKPLLSWMENKNKMRVNAIMGDDLSQAGLHMDSGTGKLSRTFASPWREASKYPVIPDYKLPACYSIDTVVPQQQKLQNFDEGALFYIFYTMPRDAMQEAAAVELTNRSWRYHKELKMWLTKDPMSEPIQTNSQEESGIYIFFDPTTWKKVKREYVLFYPDIA